MTDLELTTLFRSLAAHKGLASVSLSDLAKEADITKATLFSHFTSRQDLENRLWDSFTPHRKPFEISFQGDAKTIMHDAVSHWISFFTEEPMNEVWQIVQSEKWHKKRAVSVWKAYRSMLEGQVSTVLEVLSESGKLDINEPDLASLLLTDTLFSFIDEENLNGGDVEDWMIERTVRRFVELYLPEGQDA